MTEWLKLERLEHNDLPLPKYENESSAGLDFLACLTRPCREVQEGSSFKDTKPFICCDQSVEQSVVTYNEVLAKSQESLQVSHYVLSQILSNKRIGIDENCDFASIPKAERILLTIFPGETIMISLGIKCEFKKSYVMMLYSRSSLGLTGLQLANSTAVIDSDYRGEVWAVIHNRNKHTPIIVRHGDRLVQGVITPFVQPIIVESTVGTTSRGEGGFGSTGLNIKGPDNQ